MAALAGGLVALILGIIGIIVWFPYFVKALMAGVPVMLILGGALAAYLGFEEIKDKIYKYNDKCYKFNLETSKCDKSKKIVEF